MSTKALLKVLRVPALCLLVSGTIAQQTWPVQPGSSDGTWSLAATGDTVITRPVSVYETYPALVVLRRRAYRIGKR